MLNFTILDFPFSSSHMIFKVLYFTNFSLFFILILMMVRFGRRLKQESRIDVGILHVGMFVTRVCYGYLMKDSANFLSNR